MSAAFAAKLFRRFMIENWLARRKPNFRQMGRTLWRGQVAFCLLLSMLFVWKASAADPQSYNVTIEPALVSDIDTVLRNTSLLVTLRDTAPVPPFGLITRATDDVQRLTVALNSFGYYRPGV